MKTRLIGAIVAIILALVGTFALTGYVRGADARASDGAALVSVFVVATQIPQGTKAEDIATFIVEKQIPALAAVPGRVTTLNALAGTVADTALVPGEQLISSRWVEAADLAARGDVAIPDGMQVLTLALPLERVVGGVLTPGDTVGVLIATSNTTDGVEARVSKQVFHKVLVTAVQAGTTTTPDAGADAAPVSVIMVTLARTTPDIESLVWGQQFGTVWLTIEPDTATETASRVVDGAELFQ
ncbi:Flp pilus assembly protein CpaB [Cryobacterium sp. Y11]|uniref:Flp pilus assembly protein CpaB n=1 Tax=Cryobacterium sp. Y11 TaxID=2045016 RepID=UPI000CE4156F|nr:RcpC/CpaB family pilus assembly protein [Cryobacterium sp. Y11]